MIKWSVAALLLLERLVVNRRTHPPGHQRDVILQRMMSWSRSLQFKPCFFQSPDGLQPPETMNRYLFEYVQGNPLVSRP